MKKDNSLELPGEIKLSGTASDGSADGKLSHEKKTIQTDIPRETNGPKGLEPTRYGDWENGGRCTDF